MWAYINVNAPMIVYRAYFLIALIIFVNIHIFFWPHSDHSICTLSIYIKLVVLTDHAVGQTA